MPHRLLYPGVVAATLLAAPALRAQEGGESCANPPALKVSVAATGVYRIPPEILREAFACPSVKPDRLRLANMGKETRLAASGEGLVFLGRHLAGAQSYYNEFSRLNTYWLTMAEAPEERIATLSAEPGSQAAAELTQSTRLEKDEIRVRFRARPNAPQPEVWYWARLNSIDSEPFVVPLDLRQRRDGSRPRIRVGLRGWSTLPRGKFGELPDHRVEVSLNDYPIGSAEWREQDEHVIEISDMPLEALRPGQANQLSLRVPQRSLAGEPLPAVDAVLLNWVEVDYGHRGVVSAGQHSFKVPHADGGWFELSGPDESAPVVISEQGRLIAPAASLKRGQRYWHRYFTDTGASAYSVVAGDAFYFPEGLAADNPSDLRGTAQQADYLMISHRLLRDAIEPLAEFHRGRGLAVRVIDVEDVYDEFNHGVLAPAAIRDFIRYAYHRWQAPRPRFVLLVGDASWDTHEEIGHKTYADWTFSAREKGRFITNSSHRYDDDQRATHRNLIPTWPVDTYEGYAASDNVFVTVDGDDFKPDLAIGRFPVVEPADVTAIVNKTIGYHERSGVGPWRSKVMWITNEQVGLQRSSDRLDQTLGQVGFAGSKVYPSAQEKDNREHQATLQSSFDDGQLLVHFLGHGGRYIWRTGPPDYRKNHDLFTLDHLEQLAPNTRLPFVMSMTCYSAPFDHPNADSIGEKFLRLPDRGAIAILAASWRNSPGLNFSQSVLNELTRPGTIGEAVMRAKQQSRYRLLVETYNLLGDPATRLAIPAHTIALEANQRGGYLELNGQVVGTSFDGQVTVSWQDAQGAAKQSEQVPLRDGEFKLRLDVEPAQQISSVRAYAWNPEQNIDAMGAMTLVDHSSTQNFQTSARRAASADH